MEPVLQEGVPGGNIPRSTGSERLTQGAEIAGPATGGGPADLQLFRLRAEVARALLEERRDQVLFTLHTPVASEPGRECNTGVPLPDPTHPTTR